MKDINQYEVVGSRGVLIELEKFGDTPTAEDSKIFVPKFDLEQSESGRMHARVKDEVCKSKGKVIQISDKAKELLEEEKMDIKVGDMVAVAQGASSSHSWFIVDRDIPVIPKFEGYILVHPNSIQAKIKNNEQ